MDPLPPWAWLYVFGKALERFVRQKKQGIDVKFVKIGLLFAEIWIFDFWGPEDPNMAQNG